MICLLYRVGWSHCQSILHLCTAPADINNWSSLKMENTMTWDWLVCSPTVVESIGELPLLLSLPLTQQRSWCSPGSPCLFHDHVSGPHVHMCFSYCLCHGCVSHTCLLYSMLYLPRIYLTIFVCLVTLLWKFWDVTSWQSE